MFKSSVSFSIIVFLLMTLSSCGQSPETSDAKQPLNIAVEKEKVDQKKTDITNDDVSEQINQQTITQSAMDKISPDVLANLDLDLKAEYSVGEGGPREWDEETWAWKILLNWGQYCNDYPSVAELSLNSSPYSFIQVDCGVAAANAYLYAFLFDKNTKKSIRIQLYEEDDPVKNYDSPYPFLIVGLMELDPKTNVLSLVNRSAGGSCGTYRLYDFVEGDSVKTSKFKRTIFRQSNCNNDPALDKSPFESSDYKNWPIVEDLSTLE